MAKAKVTQRNEGKIIRNMGLFWRRDQVMWRGNRREGPGSLRGYRRGAKRAGDVDFWNQVGIYALYAEYRLVYVGQAGIGDRSCIGGRLKQHTKDDLAGRWDMFSWFGLCKVNNNLKLGARFKLAKAAWRSLADILEGVTIEIAEPPMNSQKGRFGTGVHRYLQTPLKKEEHNFTRDIAMLSKTVARIEKRLKKL